MRLIKCSAIAAVLIVVAAPTLVGLLHAQDRNRVTMCANNLRQLWTMQMNYSISHGGRMKSMPAETGPDFWLALSKTVPPLIDKEGGSLYQCPVKNREGAWGTCAYRGPAVKVSALEGKDPVGADVDGNHGVGRGGNVLVKSGDVLTAVATDELWKLAAQKTTETRKAAADGPQVDLSKLADSMTLSEDSLDNLKDFVRTIEKAIERTPEITGKRDDEFTKASEKVHDLLVDGSKCLKTMKEGLKSRGDYEAWSVAASAAKYTGIYYRTTARAKFEYNQRWASHYKALAEKCIGWSKESLKAKEYKEGACGLCQKGKITCPACNDSGKCSAQVLSDETCKDGVYVASHMRLCSVCQGTAVCTFCEGTGKLLCPVEHRLLWK